MVKGISNGKLRMVNEIEYIKEKLKNRLTNAHYEHCMRTAEAAVRMARAFGVDEEKAYLAGLLHDYSRSMSAGQLVSEAERLGLEINPVEAAFPYLLHAKVGACLVELDLNIKDKEIISAIENHTIGSVSMSKLDKIVYVADMIEPGRPHEGLDALRRIALECLDEVFEKAYVHSFEYLIRSKQLIHPLTVEVWNKLIAKNNV